MGSKTYYKCTSCTYKVNLNKGMGWSWNLNIEEIMELDFPYKKMFIEFYENKIKINPFEYEIKYQYEAFRCNNCKALRNNKVMSVRYQDELIFESLRRRCKCGGDYVDFQEIDINIMCPKCREKTFQAYSYENWD